MRITHYGFLLAILLAPALAQAADEFVPGKNGWVSLFDGSEMRRWEPAKGSDWALNDGVLAGSKGEVLNFWHWVDFQLVAVLRGAGALRCRVSQAPLPDQPGYWLDLVDGTLRATDRVAQPLSAVREQGRIVAKGAATGADGWREVRLIASRGTFTVFFDGKQVAQGKDDACPAMGQIGLAADGGKPLALKLLRIRPLNREEHINIPAPDSACFVCHDNFRREKIARKHRRDEDEEDEDRDDEEADHDHLKPAKQRPKVNGCAGCHGPSLAHRSDEDNVTAPDVLYLRGEVEAACLRCHLPHKKETHRDDQQEGPLPPNPVCTDCHGRHRARN